MNSFTEEFNSKAEKIITSLREVLKTIRTGRANPSLVENLIVETYGGQAKLKLLELASIISEGPAVIAITPFDPSVLQDIEKAILKSPLGINPANQGNRIIIRIPPLSHEQREKMVKLISQEVETKKSSIRSLRDDIRKQIKLKFEAKEITEDDKFRWEKEIDNLIQKVFDEAKLIKEKKEQEIFEV